MQEKHNKMLNDYTNVKHSYESVKFDMETQRKAQTKTTPQRKAQTKPPVTAPPLERPIAFTNPYAQSPSPPP